MDKQELNLILEEGEGYFSEFKETPSKLDKEIVAFANSSGGRIFLGITDTTKIKGFKLDNRTKSEIQSVAENCDPPIRITIEKFENIAIIKVPEGNRKPYKCSSGFYLRNGATSQKMNTSDIVAFLQYEGRIRFDELFEKKFDFKKDFDSNKYQNFIRKCGISSEYDYHEVLLNLGLLDKDDNDYKMNNTGILFFAKNPPKYFVQSIVTGVLYKGNEKLNILDRKDFSGDLISNIEDAILFLKKHLNISYKIKTLQREEILEIPETALREAIVNSVVHRDYFEKGANVVIEIYDDRVEISNPGGLPKGLNEADFGTKSVARNPLIASLMLRANYIEKLGTGIKRIQDALKEVNLPPPVFEKGNFFTIKFLRTKKVKKYTDNLRENVGVNVGVFFGEDFTEDFIENFTVNFANDFKFEGKQLLRLLKILELAYQNKLLSGVLSKINFEVSARTLKTDIAKLKNIGFIEYIGSDKTGQYITTNKFLDYLEKFK